jgi:hypothetical protein
VVRYSAKPSDEQASLSGKLARIADTVLHICNVSPKDYSPTGDGGFAIFDTGLQALPFAERLGKYAKAWGITIRIGINHGMVAFANRGPVGPGVLRADKISAQAPDNGIAILARVWRSLDGPSQEDWRATKIADGIFALEAIPGAVVSRASALPTARRRSTT